GMAHLALQSESLPKIKNHLEKIKFSGEHLLGIIDEILDFSKLDAKKVKLDNIAFKLNGMIENVIGMTAEKAHAKGIELTVDVAPSLDIELHGDPLRLSQVLINFIDNAIKFTKKGRVTLRVHQLDEDESSCTLRFEVQDTGIGISGMDKCKLFQPFQQADASITREYGGTGLGLAISKQLVEMMNDGKIGVQSSPGEGSAFWFSARFNKSFHPIGKSDETYTEQPSGMPPSFSGARILIAENHPLNQEVIIEFLENADAIACVAQNGAEAIDLLTKEHFDCVFMDVQMPVMDGYQATRLIRADPALANIPIIAMTANVGQEDRDRCLAAGMNDFISKPFKPQKLYAMLAKWLPKHSAPHANGQPAEAVHEELKSDPAVIDFSVLAELVGTEKQKMREFARRFVKLMRNDMEVLMEALELEDIESLQKWGHNNKSTARMIGAIGFSELCQTLEWHSKNDGNIEQARQIASKLHLLLNRINEQISHVLT
ncbi:MAG TPA: response regulator, partial [Gallionella sp.]|nr:response regulator [Gallionella sp.]